MSFILAWGRHDLWGVPPRTKYVVEWPVSTNNCELFVHSWNQKGKEPDTQKETWCWRKVPEGVILVVNLCSQGRRHGADDAS